MAFTEAYTMYTGEDQVITWSMQPVENITGWTLFFSLRHKYLEPLLLSKSLVITDAVHGLATLTILSADTLTLDIGRYIYDIQRTNTGFYTVLTTGTFTIFPKVG